MPTEQATDGVEPNDNGDDDTVPEVELALYQASVRVQGRADDDLDAVQTTARELIDHLIDQAATLEEDRDGRGLG